MNIQEMPRAIPQAFYDLIARVIPGFIFLFMLKFALLRTEFSFGYIDIVPTGTWFGALFNGIGYIIICYLLGWFLRPFSTYKLESGKCAAEGEPSLDEMYHMIRLENEAAGFRIAKLRAEVRMLACASAGMWLVLVFTAILFMSSLLGWIELYAHLPWYWVFKFAIPLALAIAFRKALRPARNRCTRNIRIHHRIIFVDKSAGRDS